VKNKNAFQNSFEFWVVAMIGLMLGITGFLFVNKASASVAVEQLTVDTGESGIGSPYWAGQKLGTGLTGTVTNIKAWGTGNSCSGMLYESETSSYEYYNSTGLGNICHTDGYNTSIVLDPTHYYYLQISDDTVYGTTNADAWPAGEACKGNPFNGWDSCNLTVKDFGFRLTGATRPDFGPPPSSISLLTPTTSTVADFRLWETSYDNTTTTAGKIKTLVFYSTASDPNVYVDASVSTTTASSTSFFQTKGRAIPLNQQWLAYAGLYLIPDSNPETSILLATSTITAFTLTTPIGGGIYGTSTPTSTTSTLSVTCDPSLGAFQYSFCYVIQYLFYPSSDDLDIYNTVYDGIKNKPPFGYFTAISSVLGGFSTTTTSTISFPDLSSMNDEFDVIKTTVSVILWVAFGFWVFHKFRNIQL